MSRHNRRAGHVDQLLGRNIRPETGDHVHMAFNEHDNDPGPLRSTLARADASPAPPARRADEFAPKRAGGPKRWCGACATYHPADDECFESDDAAELRALAATATDRHPGAGSGDQRAVDRYRRPDGCAGDGREFNGPEQPRMGGTPGLPDAGAPRVGEMQPSAQQQIIRLRELVDAALVNLGQAHSAELAAAHDRVLAAERQISERDGYVAKLLVELEDATRREVGLCEKIDSMIGHAGRIAEIAKAPPKTGE